jgi:hypothetical protein
VEKRVNHQRVVDSVMCRPAGDAAVDQRRPAVRGEILRGRRAEVNRRRLLRPFALEVGIRGHGEELLGRPLPIRIDDVAGHPHHEELSWPLVGGTP